MFGIARDRDELRRLDDGRWGKTLSDPAHCELEDRFFHRPILVARDPGSGLALVFSVRSPADDVSCWPVSRMGHGPRLVLQRRSRRKSAVGGIDPPDLPSVRKPQRHVSRDRSRVAVVRHGRET